MATPAAPEPSAPPASALPPTPSAPPAPTPSTPPDEQAALVRSAIAGAQEAVFAAQQQDPALNLLDTINVEQYRNANTKPHIAKWYWLPFIGWAVWAIKCWINHHNWKNAEKELESTADTITKLNKAIAVANNDIRDRYLLMQAKEYLKPGDPFGLHMAKEDLDLISPEFQQCPEFLTLRSVVNSRYGKNAEASADIEKAAAAAAKALPPARPSTPAQPPPAAAPSAAAPAPESAAPVPDAAAPPSAAPPQSIDPKVLQAERFRLLKLRDKEADAKFTREELEFLVFSEEEVPKREQHVAALLKLIDADTSLNNTQKGLLKARAQHTKKTFTEQRDLFYDSIALLGDKWVDHECGHSYTTESRCFVMWMPGDDINDMSLTNDKTELNAETRAVLEQSQGAFDRAIQLAEGELKSGSTTQVQGLADWIIERSKTALRNASQVLLHQNYSHAYRTRHRRYYEKAVAGAERNLRIAWDLYQKIVAATPDHDAKIQRLKDFRSKLADYRKKSHDATDQTEAEITKYVQEANKLNDSLQAAFKTQIEDRMKEVRGNQAPNADAIAYLEKHKDHHPEVGSFIAECHANGWGVQKDLLKALQLYELAKKDAQIKALINSVYEANKKQEDPKAIEFLLKAQEKHPLAREYLADCYANGQGVVKDYVKAYELYESAKASGQDCENSIDRLLTALTKTIEGAGREGQPSSEADLKVAIEVFERAQVGRPFIAYQLGLCYEKGIGVERNLTEAWACYKFAATPEKLKPVVHAQLKYAILVEGRSKDERVDIAEREKALKTAKTMYEQVANDKGPHRYEAQLKLAFLMERKLRENVKSGKKEESSYLDMMRAFMRAIKTAEVMQAEKKAGVEETGKEGAEGAEVAVPGGELTTKLRDLFFALDPGSGGTAAGDKAEMQAIIKNEGKHRNVMLGICYEEGLGCDKDPGKAAQQYLEAANAEDAEGQYRYGLCIKAKNPAKAREYFEAAAKQGYKPAIEEITPRVAPGTPLTWTCKNIREILTGPVEQYYWSPAYEVGGYRYQVGIRTTSSYQIYFHVQCQTAEKDFAVDFQIGDKEIWTAKKLKEKGYETKKQTIEKMWDISTWWSFSDVNSSILPDGSLKVSVIIHPI